MGMGKARHCMGTGHGHGQGRAGHGSTIQGRPVRVDMAFANAAFLAEYPALKCRVLRTHDLALLSDHLPLKCGS